MPNNKLKTRINILTKILVLIIIALFLWACSTSSIKNPDVSETIVTSSTQLLIPATVTPSETFTPTISPTYTSTPVPTLVSHEWSQTEPLVIIGWSGGDGGCGAAMGRAHINPVYNTFTLLSSGELYIIEWNDELNNLEMKTTTLSRQKTCNFLNSIDQTGFFDYDPSTYGFNYLIMGSTTMNISINTWRSNSVSLYGLQSYIDNEDYFKEGCGDCLDQEFPTILPSIRKTYQLLNNYKPDDMQIYQSDRLGVWVGVDTLSNNPNQPTWPIKSIKLSRTVFPEGYSGDEPNIILTGTNAKTVYDLFNNSIYCGPVIEEDKMYLIYARPLLPNEYSSEPLIPTTISCTPLDGWVEIP